MTPENRARMRSTLRQALGRAFLLDAGLTHPGSLHSLIDYAGHAHADGAPLFSRNLIDRFRAELTALGGEVHEAESEAEVLVAIRRIIGRETSPDVLMWEDEALPVRGLREALLAAGISVTTQTPNDMRSAGTRSQLAACTVGITGADAGLAETGSIVVVSGPGRGRLASLLPPVHIALLSREVLVSSLPVLLATRPDLVTSGSNFVCITGPSRTADIEHTLSRGVHGPKEIHVIVI